MNTELKKWYAVYTRPRWEKKVAEGLQRKGIEHYCPLNKVVRQWSDRKKLVEEPLFTSYVFIRVSEAEHLQVKQTDGVINLVYWLGRPAVIKEAEITAIKRFLNDYQNVQLERTAVNINDTVRIVQGPLLSMEGPVVEVMTHSVKVLLPSLGFTMSAQVERSHVEKIFTPQDNEVSLHKTKALN